jgi:hypothetical protein
MKRAIHVLSPTRGYSSDVHTDCFAQLAVACAARGIALTRTVREIPGLLEHARNTLCGDVIEDRDPPGAYLWLDADCHFHPSLVFESFERPEALIARAYPQRLPNWDKLAEHVSNGVRGREAIKHAAYQFGVGLTFKDGKPAWSADGRLLAVRHLGFGWVMAKAEPFRAFLQYLAGAADRDAAELMARTRLLREELREAELAKLLESYQRMDSVDFASRRTIHAFAHCAIDGIPIDGGEDTSFFYRWRTWGKAGPVWLDPWEPIGNGDKTGAYIDYMREHFGPSRADLGLPALPVRETNGADQSSSARPITP